MQETARANYITTPVVSGYKDRPTATIGNLGASMKVGREISRMSPEIRAVHYALEEYFQWATGGMRAMGMSSRSIIGRLMDEGPTAAGQKGSVLPPEMPAKLQDVLAALNDLPDIRLKAITYTYNASVPVEVVAAKLNTSVSRARNLVAEARQRIASFLAGRGWSLNPD